MGLRSLERTPLFKGAKIKLGGNIIVNDDVAEDVDKGGTCLVYRGHVESGSGLIEGTSVIIKEFYPKTDNTVLDIERQEDGRLKVSPKTKDTDDYKEKYKQFMKGVESQKKLSRSLAMEIAIKPLIEGEYGDTYYLVSDIHMGKDIKKVKPASLAERLQIAICVVESMHILHETGYVMPDFKPENLMFINRPAGVRVIDTDSLWNYHGEEQRLPYGNLCYADPQLVDIREMLMEPGNSMNEIEKMVEEAMTPLLDIYSMGVFCFEIFLQWLPKIEIGDYSLTEPLEDIFKTKGSAWLLKKFTEFYKGENIPQKKLEEVGKRLLKIIEKATYMSRYKRENYGYDSAQKMFKDLSEVYSILTSETLVTKKEIAKANGIFAAYNMLQKYPLFKYTVDNNKMSVVLAGNHIMMSDMLSAVISIGQMLDKKLEIHLVGCEIEKFWENYVSEENNVALKRVVVLSKDGKIIASHIDTNVVDRALAEIELHTNDSQEVLRELASCGKATYFVLLDENSRNNQVAIELLRKVSGDRKTFVGYLQEEDENELNIPGMNLHGISTISFCSTYNEKMFEERIYRMGLMAHAYYMGYMKKDIAIDIDELEAEFRKDIYNIASSERAGLHSIYKMASIGIDIKKPGRILNFYREIQKEEILEKLAWLEHLSWSAYMLTSGAVPATIEEFYEYAYKANNDWKCKDDKRHLKHPLLAASKTCRRVSDDMWAQGWKEIDVETLDNLDQVSVRIFDWYDKHKDIVKSELERYMEACEIPDEGLKTKIKEEGQALIDNACKRGIQQNQNFVRQWNLVLLLLENYRKEMSDLKRIMKPVVDSYRECDFKALDRELVFAVVDMLV